MRRKHSYRTVEVQQVELGQLMEQLPHEKVIVALDVAKRRQVAAICDEQGQHQVLVKFEHPEETPSFLDLMSKLVERGKRVQAVMEPTGTYGDILCHQAARRGLEVHLINPKKTHDVAEVFDGVPSYHDAKDATVIGRLHAQGVSQRWRAAEPQRREVRAVVTQRELYARQQEVLYGELEALLARHWPEAQQVLEVRKQRSALAMLSKYADPRQVVREPEEAKQVLRRASRGKLGASSYQELIEAATKTLGVEMLPQETELVQQVAGELLRLGQQVEALDHKLSEQLAAMPALAPMAARVGSTTTAVLYAHVGEPGQYSCAAAWEKAMGLNLREASSGEDRRRKYRPGVHITKRGPGLVRKYLYLATLRWLQQDAVAVAWYQKRVSYTEKHKGGAVVALMRKLVRGLWHLGRGEPYQAEKLFDLRGLTPVPMPPKRNRTPSTTQAEVTM